MTQLTHKQQQLFNALSIVVGNAMYALTVVLFLMPSGLITGGATGIALAFNKVTGLPVSCTIAFSTVLSNKYKIAFVISTKIVTFVQ